jgi:hypothetical protein
VLDVGHKANLRMPFCQFLPKVLSEMERKNCNCLRAKPEFYNFSAMSLELSKIGKLQVSKWAL